MSSKTAFRHRMNAVPTPTAGTIATCNVLEYRMVRTALGWMAVVGSPAGVRLIYLADTPEALGAGLKARLPGADLVDAGRQTAKWAESIIAYCDGQAAGCNVPLDIQGTAFQKDVWQALAAIPNGKTSTYSEIAKQIGRPKAVRAVGSACGANPLAPIIPCHRVLSANGTIGGYGYGLDCKRILLEREGITGL